MPLDVGLGLILGIVFYSYFGLDSFPSLLLLGAFLTLLPDVDFAISKLRRTDESRHRNLVHIPLILVPAGFLAGYLISGPLFGLFVSSCLLAHLLHDSLGIGWGVRWLYPFTTDSYTFFYHVNGTAGNSRIKPHLLYKWKERNLEGLVERFGDPHWVRHIYLQVHPYAMIEWAVLIIGLITYVQWLHQ